MRYLSILVFLLSGYALAAQKTDADRRHYRPSRSFLENSNENCYEATRREADRAFAQRCWDDASLLYRAAKNCADADQKRRQEMSDRLDACRAAAELELINRERHAIAANRADDSHELLRNSDRSLAYRMADFANYYIAPPGEDNPDCQQAMFDAWYASPGAIGADQDDTIQTPFCYQLGENLGDQLIVRFAGKGNQKKIYAFSPSRHFLYSWNARTLEQYDPAPVDPNVKGFEVAPDGNTFLLYAENLLIFWRKGRELYRLNVPRMHDFCFDERGDEFFMLDTIEKKIEVLGLKEVYLGLNNNKVQQKQRKLEEVHIPPTFRPWMTGVGPGVLDFAVSEGDVWLGYADSLVVLRKTGSGKGWQIVEDIPMHVPPPGGLTTMQHYLQLLPDTRQAFYGTDTSATLLSVSNVDAGRVAIRMDGFPLAFPSNSGQVATLEQAPFLHAGKIHVYNAAGGLDYVGALPDQDYYSHMTGVLDPDGDWLVLPSTRGVLHCWRLNNNGQNIFYKFADNTESVTNISPDGHYYVAYNDTGLSICDGQKPGEVLHSLSLGNDVAFDAFADKMSDHWMATPCLGDSMLVWNWDKNRKWRFEMPLLPNFPVAFTPDEKYLAAAYQNGQVRVYDLATGMLAATRTFTGDIREMAFVPGTDELILLQVSTSDYDYTQKTILRIIHPFKNDYRQRTVRLHEYFINSLAVSAQGDLLALSDGLDIRIFSVDNLTDEMAQILPTGEGSMQGTSASVLAIQFAPDGRSLVTTYSDQSVVSWNIETGMANFKLKLPAEVRSMFFTDIRMIPEGNLMCLLAPHEGLLIRTLDPAAIRAAIQPNNYQLIAFTPDQIRKYSLDQALNYEGNFERLANSGDIPLINSFFNYYFQQAGASSNIERVSEYCDRAFVLYSQLDTATRRELKPTMLFMYENYLWKWLIRDRPEMAQQVLQYVNRQFNKPDAMLLSEAHIALVKGTPEDLRRAVRLYGDWIIRMGENTDYGSYVDPNLRLIFDKFVQLAEFELIGDKQIDCLCGMFGEWKNFSLCDNRRKDAALVPFDAEMKLRWEIYKKAYLASQTERFAEQVRLFDSAREDARQLSRTKPALGRAQLEKVSRQMAESYLAWARFEQNSNRVNMLCKQGIALLEETGAFHQQEQQRLESLAYLYHVMSTDLFNKDQFDAADEACRKGYGISEKLWAATTDTFELQRYADELVGNQLTLMGNISLLQGDFVTARTAFDEANNILSQGLNSYFSAHVDIMEGKEIDALINYGGIFTTEQLGNALFDLQRLADRFPGRRDSILEFMPRMRTAWLANHLRSSSLEVDHRYASLQTHHAAELKKYDKALEWNTQALQIIQQLIQNKNTAYSWGEFWADAVLNQSFYMVFNSIRDTSLLTQAIQTAQAAEQKVLQEGDGLYVYGSAEYLKTNMAHAYLLRNRSGDREKAIETYREFLLLDVLHSGRYWDVLLKDFRDLHAAGIKWPDLKSAINEIKPAYVTLSAEEWRELGLDVR
ncbi:MAG TPA: hypothetical protein PLO67_07170 [Saprospiraceae bacterium]|nr:hypothetical protein [Saprospiraceae bacterium]HPI08076.1 hypothetical protein [Saprospiraceae bacterium]